MMLRPLIALLLVLSSCLLGQETGELMRKGIDALNASLWETAALHFEQCLSSRALGPAEKSQVAIRLAEAWVRDGKSSEALDLLGQSFVSSNPEAVFWKGMALAGLGRYADAVTTLSPLMEKPDAPHRGEACFTIGSLQLALGVPDAALKTLAILARDPDTSLAAQARLRQVEIMLDLGRPAQARETMPDVSAISPDDRLLAAFLKAHILLADQHPAEAAAGFQSLIDQPQGQSSRRYHAAAVGLADALRAEGKTDEASSFLLSFIQDHPDSPFLRGMFQFLSDCMTDPSDLTDDVLERISRWITPDEVPATGAIARLDSSAVATWPSPHAASDLLACALYTRALALHRNGTPEARAEARCLLTRLRMEFPGHALANRALFETARWLLADGRSERAFGILETIRETAAAPEIRGQAAFLEARSAGSDNDRDRAVQLFEEAARYLSENEAQAARLNAEILRLSDGPGATKLIKSTEHPEDAALAVDLELERALMENPAEARRAAIGDFLTKNPDHPRAGEARLAAAEAALSVPKPDLALARAQLDALAADAEKSSGLSPIRIALVRLRIADLSNDAPAAIATARDILKQFPADAPVAEASMVLGRNLFQTRSYNDARLVLEKLVAADPDPELAQAACLLAARAAALVPTSQSQQEAITLFDNVIKMNGSVAPVAMLEKARLMIDMNRLVEAAVFLRKWFNLLKPADALHLPAGLLLAEAIYAQGSGNPNSLSEALAVYDKLLIHTQDNPAVFNRLQYLRGRTLEQIPDEKDPLRKREKQAFIAYYSVLEITTAPAEWHYFELCGFRALALLEKADRWSAAIACAKKIASFKGPRAAEAAAYASQLQLKHMIWQD